MRIDLFNATQVTEATKQAIKLSSDGVQTPRNHAVTQNSPAEDTTSLSSSSDSVSSLTQSALQTNPSRADKVASLKQAVSSGEYQLDPAKIADAISHSDV